MGQDGGELERRVKSDPEVFSLLYEQNYDRIFNYLLYSTGDLETALDLTSETFLKAYRSLPSYRYTGAPFGAWLHKIASREVAMHFRRIKLLNIFSAGSTPHKELDRLGSAVVREEIRTTRSQIEQSDDFMFFSGLLRSLPKRYREVLFLRFYEDMSFAEISSVLNRSVSTVRSQNHRGLKILRRMMQRENADDHLSVRGLETSFDKLDLTKEVD